MVWLYESMASWCQLLPSWAICVHLKILSLSNFDNARATKDDLENVDHAAQMFAIILRDGEHKKNEESKATK